MHGANMKDLVLLNRVYPGKKNQVKRLILKHAVCCFYEFGIEASNLEMIKERANVSIGTIYYHFKSKEGLVAQLVLTAVNDIFNYRKNYLLDAKSFEECVYALVIGYIDWVEDHPKFAQIMFAGKFDVHTSLYQNDLNKSKSENRKKLQEWFELPEFQHDFNGVPLDIISSLINGPVEHYCRYWLLNRVKNSPKKFKKELAQSAWNSIYYFNKNTTNN